MPRINIVNSEHDPLILSEMIGLVDKEKMRKMMSASASFLNKTNIEISEDMVDQYLKKWAEAKYDHFLIFDKNIKISKEIELKMTNDQMSMEISQLASQYKQYAILLKSIKPKDYIENTFTGFATGSISKDEEFVRQIYTEEYFKKGRKLSTALSELIQDKGYTVSRTLADGTVVEALHSFDIELSKIMQTKNIKGNITLSIDPCDYLMMSTNKHNWISCMALAPECTGYNNVLLSKILDECTVIGYKCSDSEVDYNIKGFSWKHISMQARYSLFLDKVTGSCGIDTGQGGANKTSDLQSEILTMFREQITNHFKVPNKWSSGASIEYPTDRLSYNEGVRLSYQNKAFIGNRRRKVYFEIGVDELVCPNCGKIVRDRGNFICCNKK